MDFELEPGVVAKADALIEALGYVQRFNKKLVVVKLGGSFMDSDDEFRKVLTDVVFMHAVGMRPVVVHGGGKAITSAMEKAGLKAQFVMGRRYTDERTLALADEDNLYSFLADPGRLTPAEARAALDQIQALTPDQASALRARLGKRSRGVRQAAATRPRPAARTGAGISQAASSTHENNR